ncbi:hypothetical protein ACP4OV_000925 [Aristida adscensionis]
MSGDEVLDSLMEVFPLVNFSTLIEVSIQFKDDIDGAADYVIQNVLPNIVAEPSHPNTNEDLYIQGHQQAFDGTCTQQLSPVDNNTDSVQFHPAKNVIVENADSLVACMSEELSSDSLPADSQLGGLSSKRSAEISASELHDVSPDVTVHSSYSVNPESLDDVIAGENYKKITLLSNLAAINEMLQEVELNEEKTKSAISEASHAGNDILVKVEELKEMTALAVEDNNKVAGEIFAEKSILAAEAHELQTRLFNISEETKNFVLTIDEMHNTLQRRVAAAEEERVSAEKEKLEREALAQKSLKEHEYSLEAAREESKKLEQQAQENAKLKELLIDRGHVVDALHGEMLGIFDSITQLKLRVDMQLPVDEPVQQVSSSLCGSAVVEPLQQVSSGISSSRAVEDLQLLVTEPLQRVSSSFSSSAVVEPLHQVSSSLSSSVACEPLLKVSSSLPCSTKSASSLSSSVTSLASKSSWSSASELNTSFKDNEKTAEASDGNFDLDDSWDVVVDED